MDTTVTFLRPAEPAEPTVPEPDWGRFFTDPAEQAEASALWLAATREMTEAATLSPGNAPALQRYVVACIVFSRVAATIGRDGAVIRAKRTGAAAHRPEWAVMRDADALAAAGEERLGLSPRSRGKATAAPRRPKRAPKPLDRYLPPR